MTRTIAAALLCTLPLPGAAVAQPRFDDVVRNLRHPDPQVRVSAVRLLREAQYPEAIVPMAPLVNDPVDAIQLEAIAAILSFYLVDEIRERRRVGLVLEVRSRGIGLEGFERGPLGVWPRPAPPVLVSELLQAVDDEHPRVRLDAIYALGTIASAPLGPEGDARLVQAIDHYDPAIRAAAARVAGRLEVHAASDVLIKAINDSSAAVRHAAMRALGSLREELAIVPLTEQLTYYGRGEGAAAALDGLARIAHPASVQVFTSHLTAREPELRRAAAEGLGRTGAAGSRDALETAVGGEPSPPARAAMTFALQRLGGNYVPRLAEYLNDSRTRRQVQDYLLELGASIEHELLPALQDPGLRGPAADVLGEIGGDATLAALQGLANQPGAGEAPRRAAERIRMRRAS
jgi:HEAT repeat protein